MRLKFTTDTVAFFQAASQEAARASPYGCDTKDSACFSSIWLFTPGFKGLEFLLFYTRVEMKAIN